MASAASIASLASAVETAIVRRESVGARRGLEEVIRVNKPALIALLKNPVRTVLALLHFEAVKIKTSVKYTYTAFSLSYSPAFQNVAFASRIHSRERRF